MTAGDGTQLVTHCKPLGTSATKLKMRLLTFDLGRSLMGDGHERSMARREHPTASGAGPWLRRPGCASDGREI